MTRRPRFAPSRRTSASLAAPPARLAHAATTYGQRRQHQAGLAESPAADQERVKPRLEEVVDVDVAEREPEHRPHCLRPAGRAPREAMAGRGGRATAATDGRRRARAFLRANRGTTRTRPPPRRARPRRTRRTTSASRSASGSAAPAAARWRRPPGWPSGSRRDIVARCAGGNHRDTTIEAFGNAPASPAPNRNRTTSSG